jgi:hypothetical protein
MTKEQAIKRKAELESELKQVEKIIQQPEISKEQRFWGLIDGLQLRVDFDKYPDIIFLFNGDKWCVEYDTRSRGLWLRDSAIWSVLHKEYNLNDEETQSFIEKEGRRTFQTKGRYTFFSL